MKTFRFSEFDCTYSLGEYTNGGTAIRIIDANDGMPVATASVWIGNLFNDEIAIKDYSENEGILDALVQAEIVHPPHRSVNGFPVVRLKRTNVMDEFIK
jgi:hypothetical protein